MPRPPLIVIAGPTASGKSALALALAERIDGTVVNADSMQVYRDLRILTARPDPAEAIRAPHRLFGYVDGADAYSAERWANDARGALAEAVNPILVGGTGLYLRTLLDGIAPVPAIDPAVRAAVRALPVADAYRSLAEADPAAATRLNAADTTRVARALEVVRATGRTLAEWQAERVGGVMDAFDVRGVVLTPDRAVLTERIAARVERMLATGAIEEVERLMARKLDPNLPVMRAIGVAALADRLARRISAAEASARIVSDTRRYAKRQDTWFRHQAPPAWLRTPDTQTALAERYRSLRA